MTEDEWTVVRKAIGHISERAEQLDEMQWTALRTAIDLLKGGKATNIEGEGWKAYALPEQKTIRVGFPA